MVCPEDEFFQNTSDLPSPLKSPAATTCHAWMATVVCTTELAIEPDDQTTFSPVDEFLQNTSACPSPLKSPITATRQALATVAPNVILVGSAAHQIKFWPLLEWRQN